MRKPITVNTIEELKSVAFDYNAPVFVGPDILISEFISTDDECDKLIEKLEHYHKSVIAFCFSHDGFRVHFLMIDNFVVLKKYGIENVTIMNLKKFVVHSIRFDTDTHDWSEKEFYSYKRGNKPISVSRNYASFIAKYSHVYDKTYVSEIRVTDNSQYLIDMTFSRNGRKITLMELGAEYPEIVSALRGKVRSVENLTNKSKLIKSYLPIIDMILI
jgi:hypothetical protein